MRQEIIDFLDTIHPMSNEAKELFFGLCELIEIPKNTHLLHIDEVCDSVYFVLDGIVRVYVKTDKNKEVNKALMYIGDLCSSIHSASNRIPSYMGIECLTDCSLVKIKYCDFVKLYMNNKELSILSNRVLESASLKLESHITTLLSKNATDVYLELKKRIPKIDMLISQKHIASHIGISTIQLSRVRKKILEM